jgi:transcriptional regulator with XRE-family HTH domain
MRTAFTNAIGEIVAEARENGIKLTDLCETSGVSRATLHRYRKDAPEAVVAVDKLRVALRIAKRDQRRATRRADAC